jgi:hypothetical protein
MYTLYHAHVGFPLNIIALFDKYTITRFLEIIKCNKGPYSIVPKYAHETCRLSRKNASSREREVTSLRFETVSGGLIELSGEVWE